MINLLPPGEKGHILKNYRFRFCTTFLAVLFVVSLIAIISFFPTYFLTVSKYSSYVDNFEKNGQLKNGEKRHEVENEIRELNGKIALLTGSNGFPHARELFDMTLFQMVEGVKLTALRYDGEGISLQKQKKGEKEGSNGDVKSFGTVSIHGVASTRDDLELFNDKLQAIPMFKKADFPISSLVRERDISFVITIPLSSSEKENTSS